MTSPARQHEGGFGLVETTLALSVLVVGLMALAGALISGVRLTDDTRETHRASNEARVVIDDFRSLAAGNFETVVSSYKAAEGVTYKASRLRGRGGVPATITARAILDETQLQPPVDLNEDGDFLDTNLSPAEVNAVYLETVTTWRSASGPKTVSYGILLSRSEITGSSRIGAGGVGGGGGGGGLGGGGTPGGGSTATATVSSFTKNNEKLTIKTVVSGEASAIGMTVTGSSTLFVSEIKVDGERVHSQKKNAPPTGSVIPIGPVTLEEGTVQHEIKFLESPSGGKAEIGNESFTVVLHLDNGNTIQLDL